MFSVRAFIRGWMTRIGPRSLSRAARREQARIGGPSRLGRGTAWLSDAARSSLSHDYSFLWLLAVTVGLLFLPITRWFKVVQQASAAKELIRTLWQVEAAVLGLSVAVIILALQTFASGRFGRGVRSSARESGLLPIVYLGVCVLLVDWLVLLGVGHGAPDGWAATWAVTLGAVEFLSLFLFFLGASRAIDLQEARRRRRRQAVQEVRATVDRQVLEQLALVRLQAACGAWGVQFQWVLPPPVPPGWLVLYASKTATVKDINLWRLRRVARAVQQKASPTQAILLVRLGQRVAQDSAVFAAPAVGERRAGRASRRIVRI